MQIELIGCTSAGKSRLVQDLLHSHNQNGFELVTSYEFVLRWARMNWVKNHALRMLLLNLVALLACLFTWRDNLPFYRFAAGVIMRLPAEVSLAEKSKIARIVARNVGIYEIVRRHRSERQVVLADEGTLHIASYLFVHAAVAPSLPDLQIFARMVSLPEVAVYVRQPEAILISRTRSRGHKRIPKGTPALIEPFIKNSLVVFEYLAACANLEDRLVITTNGEELQPALETRDDPRLALARKIFTRQATP